jgi:HTH-type transcriptional regulator, sugar sensing transcriptional regulator
MNQKLLEEIGLTKGEITVYLALLKTGETTTGKIIEEAQISSGKIYEILDKLIKKGLVSYIIKEKTKYFEASSPNRILNFLKEKEQDLKKKEQQLEKEIPFLLELQKNSKKEYESTLYKGYNGIKTVILDLINNLDKEEEIYAMGLRGSKDDKYNSLWMKWHNQRIKKKVKCKMIFSEIEEYYKKLKKLKYTEVKLIEGITPSAITIVKEGILIFTFEEEPSCLKIINPEIKKSFTTFFETLWKIAKK